MEALNTKQYKSLNFDVIKVDAKMGTSSQHGLREAVILCMTEWVPVEYTCNGEVYKFDPDRILKSIQETQTKKSN